MSYAPWEVARSLVQVLDHYTHPVEQRVIQESFQALLKHLPDRFWLEDTPRKPAMAIPLYEALDNCGKAITDLVLPILFDEEARSNGHLEDLRMQLLENEATANGLTLRERRKRAIPAPNELGKDAKTLAFLYLQDTPFLDLFNAPIPFVIPRTRWPTHCVVIAPSEWGKSQLCGMILKDALTDPEPRAIILCDPHGDIHTQTVQRIPPERLVTIDLTKRPPNLNILDKSVLSDSAALSTFRFIISSLAGGLSTKQENCVKPLFALLGKIPNANLQTLHEIITEQVKKPTRFAKEIASLDNPVHRTFFTNLWYSGNFSETRDALTWKISGALDDPIFYKMFAAPTNDINVKDWIENDRVVLLKSSNALDKEGTRLFFLFVISQFYAAAKARDPIPEHKRKLAMMIFDEASIIMQSPIISDVFTELRKYNCSLTVATQLWHQIAEDVRPAVLGSTGIRFIGQLGTNEAKAVAPDMGVKDENVRALRNVPGSYAEWYLYVRSIADRAIKVTVPYGQLETLPKQKAPEPKPETHEAPQSEASYGKITMPPKGDTTTIPPDPTTPTKRKW